MTSVRVISDHNDGCHAPDTGFKGLFSSSCVAVVLVLCTHTSYSYSRCCADCYFYFYPSHRTAWTSPWQSNMPIRSTSIESDGFDPVDVDRIGIAPIRRKVEKLTTRQLPSWPFTQHSRELQQLQYGYLMDEEYVVENIPLPTHFFVTTTKFLWAWLDWAVSFVPTSIHGGSNKTLEVPIQFMFTPCIYF